MAGFCKRWMMGLIPMLALATLGYSQEARTIQSFDPDWRFLQDDAGGAQEASFNDSAWRKLDVPHDWSIEGPFSADAPTRGSGGSLPAGVGWYRKTFTLPASDSGKRVFIDFDGVMANSEVWINGKSLGKRPYGYISFRYELTGNLNFGDGKTNVVAVRADNSQQPASRWYTGAGIYRHVRLVVTDPVHVDTWGTFVTTPQVSSESATVSIASTVINQSDAAKDVTIQTTLVGPDGQRVQSTESAPQSIPAGKSVEFKQEVKVASPKLWNVESPNLYRAVVAVRTAGKTVDEDTNTFGIRHFEFKTDTGFWLNGKNFKLNGVCLHHDGGAVGAAVPVGVWERRLQWMRDQGANAIRTAHNPPSPDFLDLCDRMGFLVMDETFDAWTVQKNPFDYSKYFKEWNLVDTRDMVKRDRNHPSVILYSTGNEIHDTPNAELAKSLLKPMVDEMHKWDPTRPVTQALFRPNVSHDFTNGLADMLDVIGTNYRDAELIQAWKDKPGRKIVGTEQRHELATWLQVRDNPQHSGQFLWAGIDYKGETQWPQTTYQAGLVDRIGNIKPAALQRQSWWLTKPVVWISRTDPGSRGGSNMSGQGAPTTVRNWTLREGDAAAQTSATIYSNVQNVELFLNDKSLGSKEKPADDSPRIWNVGFEPGTIRAVAKDKDQKVVATDELRTAAKPSKIVLTVDRKKLAPGFDEVAFVDARLVDANGVQHPYAANRISFKITGPGRIDAVDNGNRVDHEIYQASERNAFEGRAIAIIKATASTGPISISASAEGLEAGIVTLEAATTTAP